MYHCEDSQGSVLDPSLFGDLMLSILFYIRFAYSIYGEIINYDLMLLFVIKERLDRPLIMSNILYCLEYILEIQSEILENHIKLYAICTTWTALVVRSINFLDLRPLLLFFNIYKHEFPSLLMISISLHAPLVACS